MPEFWVCDHGGYFAHSLSVFGSHSFARAKYLSSVCGLASSFFLLHGAKEQNQGGIFWTDDIVALADVASSSFDCVLSFNIDTQDMQETQAILSQICRILKPNGAFAGTGLFHVS